MKSNLVLCGFMGTGKSTLGPLLSERLKFSFIDLDALIEQQQSCRITDIFADQDEAAFRDLETQALQGVLAQDQQVIAVGGGVVVRTSNCALIEQRARLVCLTASIDVLLERLAGDDTRPLLQGSDAKQKMIQLLDQRRGVYESIAWQMVTNHKTFEQCVEEIYQEWMHPKLPSN